MQGVKTELIRDSCVGYSDGLDALEGPFQKVL